MSNNNKFKTNYDDELDIIKEIHELDTRECLILSDRKDSDNYVKTIEVLDTLLSNDYLEKWKDNSASNLPPDFINEKDSLILEVMRIDDHSSDGKNNPVLAREKQTHKELEESGILKAFSNAKKVICNAVTDLPTDEDHSYKNYHKSFQRVIRKHATKIIKYKQNHPNKRLIFLAMDETSGVYYESKGDNFGKPYYVFFDNKFINEFINIDIDYLIWYIPYNYAETIDGNISLPHLIIYDVKNLKSSEIMQYIDYDETKMKSNEL